VEERSEAYEEVRTLPPNTRPTLVIGLGGTGHRILVHLKRQLMRAYGAVPEDLVRLLAFDTADEPLSLTEGEGTVSLEADRELFNIGHTPVPNIIRNLDRQPAIEDRLPKIQSLPAVVLRGGARQIRPLGLLALLWRFEEVERHVGDAVWALAGKETLGQRQGTTQGINVFICNSLVGGTGAGMFIDVAYLVRALFAELGTMGDFCYVTGVGVLPQAFRGIAGPNIVPNAIAAFKELSHCMLRGGFSCQYPNGRWIESPQPPFDLYYLVDGVDEQGYTWSGLGELSAMIAAGLFLQIGSQVGRKGENDFDNLSDVLGNQTADGEGTFCGSFGMATLAFPAPDVAAWCAGRLAGEMVRDGLLRSAKNGRATAAATAFVQAHLPEADALLEDLAQDDGGVPLIADLRLPPRLQQSRTASMPADVIRYVEDYRHVRVQGDYRMWIRSNGKALSEEWRAALEEHVTAALVDPGRGVNEALNSLTRLAALLADLARKLENRRAAAQGEGHRLETELTSREETLRRAAGTLFLWRGRALETARDRYLEVAASIFNQAVQEMAWDAALAALGALTRAVTEWQHRLGSLRATLAAALRELAEEEAAFLAAHEEASEIASISLADPGYCDTLYRRHAPELLEALATLLRAESPVAWLEDDPQEVAQRLRAAAARSFQPVAEMTVEDVLRDRSEEASPQSYRERLFRLAAPSWNLDLTRLEDGGSHLRTVQVLGVPDESGSIFRDEMRMLVSTYDPTTATAFLATIGAPFSALQQYPDYERAYRRVRSARPLHVLPQFQTEGEQARLAFALGILFDMIFSRGFYFYYRPEDELDPPRQLGNGLSNAIRRFAQSDNLVQEVMSRVDLHIAEMGTKSALSLLATYYSGDGNGADGASTTDAEVLEMRKLVRSYASELRRTQEALGR
jgi:hypothetical protein